MNIFQGNKFTKYIKIFSFLIFTFFVIKVLASSSTWTFDFSTNYTYSNTSSFTVSGSIASINQNTLAHTGVINNATTYNGAYDVVVDGNYAYMTNYLRDSVSIINISNPASPTFVTEIVNNGGTIRLDGASSLVKEGNYLYVASYVSNAMQIIDVTNPAAPVARGQVFNATTMAGARGITKVGNYVYVGIFTYDALQVINVTNPLSPSIVGTYRQTTNMNGASEVKVYGNYAFVSCYNRDAVSIIDISTPASPAYITQLRDATNLNGARDLAITADGKYAYVSSYLNNTVRVIDISNPATPTAITNITGGGFVINGPRDLDIQGNMLFIAGYTSNAINIADISTPTSPTYVTSIVHNAANPLLQGANGIFSSGSLLYVASYTSDALEILRLNYVTTSPYLQPINAYSYGTTTSLLSFTQTLGAGNQGTITYQISKNGGTTWYYWNGTAWTTTVGGVANSSSAALINTNIASFNAVAGGTGQFTFKAFFTSNGQQKVELSSVSATATDVVSPGGAGGNLSIWLKANKGTNTTTDGGSVTTWADQSGNGYNATSGVAPTFTNNDANGLNYNPVITFNGSTQYLENLNNGANSTSYFMVVVPTNQVDGTATEQMPFGWDCTSGVLSSGTCGLTYAGLTFGAFTVALNDEVITHALGASTNWRSAQIGAYSYPAGEPVLMSINQNLAANGTDMYEKGVKIDNTAVNTYQTLAGANFRIGGSIYTTPSYYNGKIAEIIDYSGRVSDTDRLKLESYLALKYGMTLNSGIQNYIASDGITSIWNTTTAGTYIYNIFGIGRDDTSALGQIKSKSSNPNGIVTINALGEGTNMTPSYVDIANKEFLTISNNIGSNTWIQAGAPSGYDILTRKWKVQETGDVGTISLDFDVANPNFDVPPLSTGSVYYFAYDSNNNGLFTDEVPTAMTNTTGNIWQKASVNMSSGQLFTILSLSSSNNIPTNITLSNNLVNENVVVGTTIGTFTTTDADSGDTHTYSLVVGAGDTDNSIFSIIGTTLKIQESPDFEVKSSYSIRVQTNDGHGGLYQKIFTINVNDIGETISTIIDFETTGKYTVTSGNWTRLTTNPYEKSYSLISNNGGLPNTQSCFEVTNTLTQTGTVSFYYNVSSQAGGDYLRFYIDNVEQQNWSGTVPWTNYLKNNVTPGFHTYKWCYIKDGATNTGNDNANIDYITYQNSAIDNIPPTMISINYASGSLLPGGKQNFIINYNDAESGINPSSDIITLNKWTGAAWGADIASTGLNLAGKTVGVTQATYPTNNLVFGKYRYNFQISDNNSNSSSTGAVFYIDEPEIIISTGSFDMGKISGGTLNFSSNEITATVKTVGATFQIEMSKDTNFANSSGSIIIDWDGTKGIGYDKNPYTLINKHINNNPIVGTGATNINVNGVKNIYTFPIKIGTLVPEEQAAGTYNMNISFRAIFGY